MRAPVPLPHLTKRPALALAGVSLCGLVALSVVVFQEKASAPGGGAGTNSGSTSQTATDGNPMGGRTLYADPSSNPARQAKEWRQSRPDDAALMSKLANLPTAKWLTDGTSLNNGLKEYLSGAKKKNAMPVLVVYNIPGRDCGLYSAGGAVDLDAYRQFIDTLADTVGESKVAIIVEPDALAAINAEDTGRDCLNDQQLGERYTALRYAAKRLGQLPGSAVYLDAGNSAWIGDTKKLAERLQKAGIADTDGFSLNVSNFQTNDNTIKYGQDLSGRLEGAHFVIDTSRNGAGPYDNPKYEDFNWCNPPGRALGHHPTTSTGQPLVDAYLYVKTPGESDGQDNNPNKCHGGPRAGEWWPEYALGLIKRWPAELQP